MGKGRLFPMDVQFLWGQNHLSATWESQKAENKKKRTDGDVEGTDGKGGAR